MQLSFILVHKRVATRKITVLLISCHARKIQLSNIDITAAFFHTLLSPYILTEVLKLSFSYSILPLLNSSVGTETSEKKLAQICKAAQHIYSNQ